MKMLASLVAGLLAIALGAVPALAQCPTPNAYPFTSGCPLPAAELNAAIAATTLYTNSRNGTGVQRTIRGKLDDTVSVKDYGAIGNGATNDAPAIVLADAAANAVAAAVHFPGGAYIVSSMITPLTGAAWVGDSTQSVSLVANSAVCNILTIANPFTSIEGITFGSNTTCTSGTFIQFSGSASKATLRRLIFNGSYQAISMVGAGVSDVYWEDIRILDTVVGQSSVVIDGCIVCSFHRLVFLNSFAARPLSHIKMLSSGDITCVDCSLIGATHNLYIIPSSGDVASTIFVGGFIDNAGSRGVLIAPTSTGNVFRTEFNGTWISSSGVVNFDVSPASTARVDDVECVGCKLFGAAGFTAGYSFFGTTSSIKNAKVIGGCVAGGGGSPSGAGMLIEGVDNVLVSGTRVGACGAFPALVTGVTVAGTNGNIKLDGDFAGNTTNVVLGGTNARIAISESTLGYHDALPALGGTGGTSPSLTGNDYGGTLVFGTGSPTGATITFSNPFVVAPHCTVTWQGTPLASQSYTVSTTAITLVQTGTSSNRVNWRCQAGTTG